MIKNKFILALLAVLLVIKFIYVPWSEWVDEKGQSIEQLAAFSTKQKQAINNKSQLTDKLAEAKLNLDAFVGLVPRLKKNEKANTLWFSLVDQLKHKDLKVYNQKVEFEEPVTSELSYITGSLSISGKAAHVIQAVLSLEAKSPTVFLDKLHLNRKGKGNNDAMIAQLFVGYWFSHDKVEAK